MALRLLHYRPTLQTIDVTSDLPFLGPDDDPFHVYPLERCSRSNATTLLISAGQKRSIHFLNRTRIGSGPIYFRSKEFQTSNSTCRFRLRGFEPSDEDV